MAKRKTKEATDDEKIIKEAMEFCKFSGEFEAENRQNALDDLKFTLGEQWPETIRRAREQENRPCLTINRLQQMVKQVVNDIRQNRPAIKVHPVDSGADKDTAEVLAGIVRHIEVDSNATDAYDSAAEYSVIGGFGYFRILTQYEYDDSFDQCIKIERVKNHFTVFYDPNCNQADGSDAKKCVVIDDMPRSEFDSLYPDRDAASYELHGIGASEIDWINEDNVRVAEYFVVREEADKLYLMADGSTVLRSELPGEPPAEMVKNHRKLQVKKVHWYKLTAREILDHKEWPGMYIPIIPVWGEQYDVEGKTYRMGLVRAAKDPQRIYNFSRTAAVEQVALAPKAPFILAEGQEESYEDMWAQANTKSYAYLVYKPTTIAGVPVPPPQRQAYSGIPVGSINDLNIAADEIKSTTGIYDAALGNRSNETSGRAILARQQQGDTATYHFVDNLARAVRYCGKQLIDLIPKIYDTPRMIRILGADSTEKIVSVNQVDPLTGEPTGPMLNAGRYDVTVAVGPSYQTKRIEAADSLTAFMQANPQAAPLIGDLVAKNMDWPGAEEIAERLKMMLPPALQQQNQDDKTPPMVVAKMAEQQQVIQGLQQAMQQAMGQIQQQEQALAEKQSQLALNVASAEAKAQTDAAKLELDRQKLELEAAKVELDRQKAEAEMVKVRLDYELKVAELQISQQPAQQPQHEPVHQQPQQPSQTIIIEQNGKVKREIAIQAPSGEVYTGYITEESEE